MACALLGPAVNTSLTYSIYIWLTHSIIYLSTQVEIAKVLIHTHGVDPDKIAALTPYSAQKEEIRAQLENQNITGVVVKTITESQGA